MARWKPPTNDPGNIGAFVAQSYGKNKKLAERIYNRLRSKGARFYLDPNTSKYARITSKIENEKPDGWGSQNIAGGWWEKPNLDTSVWEMGQNTAGRWFARKPTPEQRFTPFERSQLAYFDTQASNALIPVNNAYDTYVQAAKERAADYEKNSNALNELIKNSASATPDTNMEGVAVSDLAQRNAESAAARAVASAQPQVDYYKNMPAAAEQSRANAIAQAKAASLQSRMELMSALNNQASERQAAQYAAEQEVERQRLALRGQQLSFMGQLYGTQAGMANAQLQANTSLANNSADNATAQWIANLNAATDIATRTDGGTTKPGTTTTGATVKDYQTWVKGLPGAMTGKAGDYVINPDYDPVEAAKAARNGDAYPIPKFIQKPGTGSRSGWTTLVGQGIDIFGPEYAERVVKAIWNANPTLKKLRTSKTGMSGKALDNIWNALYRTLQNSGIEKKVAQNITRKYVGPRANP